MVEACRAALWGTGCGSLRTKSTAPSAQVKGTAGAERLQEVGQLGSAGPCDY